MAEQKIFSSQQDPQWVNKTRTLIVSNRGMTAHQRHLMLSIFALLPHAKKQYKLDKKHLREQIEQLCEQHKTRYFLYFEVKKKYQFSLWIGKYPDGPTVKLLLDGVVLNKDIKFQGNSVKGSRHVLTFDSAFNSDSKLKLLRQLFIGAFNVPKYHPKSTSVIDHTLNFTCLQQNMVSFKNYQIFRQAINKEQQKIDLFQIGPRFLMKISCVLDGIMGGQVLYRQPVVKKVLMKSKADKRKNRKVQPVNEMNIFGQEDMDV